jgi:hypothetical protein
MGLFALGIEHRRFNARMTPMRAIIVGLPSSTTRISASIATCHFSGVACPIIPPI